MAYFHHLLLLSCLIRSLHFLLPPVPIQGDVHSACLGEVKPAPAILYSVNVASMAVSTAYPPRRKLHIFALLLIAGVERNPGPPSIHYGLLNVRSAVNKSAVIQDLIHTQNLDCSFFTETWFKHSDLTAIVEDIAPERFFSIHTFRDGFKKTR